MTAGTALTFDLPDLGEGLADADIVRWRVSVGDVIGADDVIAEVETAKATVELPSPHAGRVVKLHAEEGETVAVGSPLVTVQPEAAADDAGSGAVLVGYGTNHRAGTADPRPRKTEQQAPRVISPIVRKLARKLGVDLRSIEGSGPDGVVLRRDVETESRATVTPLVSTSGASRERLTGVRRVTAVKLTHSRREIPDVTTWVDADATELIAARAALDVSTLALLARIIVSALERFSDLNCSIETTPGDSEDDIFVVRHDAIHLGIATQTDRGLMVPVIRDANRLTTRELAAALRGLVERARNGELTPAELTGGTFTLNNYGVFGVDGSTPIINHPETGLLGVGRIADKPWAVGGELQVRKIVQLSLTFDHRTCDGGVAGGFLRYIADCVERPLTLLADV